MAPPTCAVGLLFLASLLYSQVWHADSHLHSKSLLSDQQLARDSLFQELENAQIQLSLLEKNLLEKDTNIFDKENSISSLKYKLQAIQEGGSQEVEAVFDRTNKNLKQLMKKASELEEALNEKGVELLTFTERAQVLEAAGKRLMVQNEELEKVLSSQRKRMDDIEQALQETQEGVRQAQAQYDFKNQELIKAHNQWLPLWASKHVSQLQNAEQIWSSVLKHCWEKAHLKVTSIAATVKEKALEGFDVMKSFLSLQLKRARNRIKKTIQVARKSSRPYMDKASVVFQPYFNRVQVLCKPYTEKITQNYKKYVKYATKYHLQLQSRVRKTLKKSNYLASIASKELVWFLASALLIMPLYGVLMLLSAVFGDRKRSTYAKGAGSHRHQKAKHSKQLNK